MPLHILWKRRERRLSILFLITAALAFLIVTSERLDFRGALVSPTLPFPCDGETSDCALAQIAFDRLPIECKTHVKSFRVVYNAPELAAFTTTYGDVWIAGDLVKPQEYEANIVHECGHITDFFVLTGTPRSSSTPFTFRTLPTFADDLSLKFYTISWTNSSTQKAGGRDDDFVSAYAQSSAVEDFGETYAYFVLQRTAFERRSKRNPVLRKKLEFMKSLFPKNFDFATGSKWMGGIPHTVSSVVYEW